MFKQRKRRTSEVGHFCSVLVERGQEIKTFHPPVYTNSKAQSTCRICGNQDGNKTLEAKEMFLGSRLTFDYVLCAKCGSLSIKNIPDNIQAYYSRYYTVDAPAPPRRPFYIKLVKRLMLSPFLYRWLGSALGRFLIHQSDLPFKAILRCGIGKTRQILDVGCGFGSLVHEMRALGYKNITGIDPYLPIMKEQINNGVQKIELDQLRGRYDFIMFNHSFEHMNHPLSVLKKVRDLLDKHGQCLIRIPNIESYAFQEFQEHWAGIHAPYHYHLPSKNGLSLIAKASGLEIKSVFFEQLPEFLLISNDYRNNIGDFEEQGIRRYLGYQNLGRHIPPRYSRSEIKHWRRKAKEVTLCKKAEWVCYLLKKKGRVN